MENRQPQSATLLIYCEDRSGIIAAVTDFIHAHEGNIIYLDQYVDAEEKIFFMRIEWDLQTFVISPDKIETLFKEGLAKKYKMNYRLSFSDEKLRMAVFVSKLPHCLYDIVSRCQSGEWAIDIPLIISNHKELEPVAKSFGIDYHYIPITPENKPEQEAKQVELLKKNNVDFIVLARYMQILSESFIKNYPSQIINIHHSFLPAFPGAKPYHSAHKRGVKIIGATSHYVTADLDEGPIIEQDVVRVTHVDSIKDLIRKGRDLEKIVLSRAVYAHFQRKTLVYKNRTIVFN
ncbi:formyltetrahydrofolate deformylase [bacterium BMS3Abin03]|jgi:formyltetrahydrofolate deformylase|nr:formyltetrahydrofolate deformylase [bacterium BMS3Abin03]MCG6959953.1 formyltetrahydrofolate deformylase [bacterium BMS3Abin03]